LNSAQGRQPFPSSATWMVRTRKSPLSQRVSPVPRLDARRRDLYSRFLPASSWVTVSMRSKPRRQVRKRLCEHRCSDVRGGHAEKLPIGRPESAHSAALVPDRLCRPLLLVSQCAIEPVERPHSYDVERLLNGLNPARRRAARLRRPSARRGHRAPCVCWSLATLAPGGDRSECKAAQQKRRERMARGAD
jgi:hypothetical protein